jgi:hypothetical protein
MSARASVQTPTTRTVLEVISTPTRRVSVQLATAPDGSEAVVLSLAAVRRGNVGPVYLEVLLGGRELARLRKALASAEGAA